MLFDEAHQGLCQAEQRSEWDYKRSFIFNTDSFDVLNRKKTR